MNPNLNSRVSGKEGQAMLLTVMMLSGVILSVSLVAGLLMIYQIRQAGNFTNSAKAIFAADSGVEWWYYHQQHNGPPSSTVTFSNGASFEATTLANGTAKIVGQAGNSKRALLVEPIAALTCNPNPDLVLVVDNSFSIVTHQDGYENALRSYIGYLSAITQDQTYFALELFNGSHSLNLPLTNVSSTMRSRITSINYGSESSGSNLDDAINDAQTELNTNDRDDSQYKDYILIVTDSVPTVGENRTNVDTAAGVAKGAGSKIIVVGIDPNPTNGPAFHGYFETLASPGHYASSTGLAESPFDQNLIEKLKEVSSSTFLNCP